MNLRALALTALTAFLTACGGGTVVVVADPPPVTPRPVPNPFPNPPTLNCSNAGLAAAAQSRWPVVCMLTSSGEIVVELFDSYAPITVNNFLQLVARDFYSRTLVHRVDRDFVIQGGGFLSGMVEKPSPFTPIVLESNNGLSNLRGTLAMARRSDPNSATSQWFLNVRDNTALDYQPATPARPGVAGYAVFGQIISGLPVLDAINLVPVYAYSETDLQPRTEVLVYWMRRVQ